MSAAKPDPTSVQLVDPTNLIVRQKSNGIGQEIVCKDKPHEKFTVLMPPMLVSFPSLAGEGILGSEFTNNEGKLVYVDKRTDAAFKLGLTIGDLNDPELAAMTPPLKQIQRDALTKIYEIGNNIIGSLYDARIDEVMRTRAYCVALTRQLVASLPHPFIVF